MTLEHALADATRQGRKRLTKGGAEERRLMREDETKKRGLTRAFDFGRK